MIVEVEADTQQRRQSDDDIDGWSRRLAGTGRPLAATRWFAVVWVGGSDVVVEPWELRAQRATPLVSEANGVGSALGQGSGPVDAVGGVRRGEEAGFEDGGACGVEFVLAFGTAEQFAL